MSRWRRAASTIVAGLLSCVLAVAVGPAQARRGALASHADLAIAAYQKGGNWYSNGRINQCPDGQLVRGFRMNIRDDPEGMYAGGIRSMGGSCNVWTPLGWRDSTDGSTGEYWSEHSSAAQSWPSNESSCPGHQVITGFKLMGRNHDYYISTLTAHCAEVKLEGSRIVMTEVADGTTGGSVSSYSSESETRCEPGMAVIGFAARGGGYFQQLSLVCAPIRPTPFTLTVTSDTPLPDYRQFGIDLRDRLIPKSGSEEVDTVALRADATTHQDTTALLPGSYRSEPVMPDEFFAQFHSCSQFAMSGFIPYSCELKVGPRIPAPVVTMAFADRFVAVNEQSTLNITLTNPNSKSILDLSLSHTLLQALVPDNNGYDETSCLSANGFNPAALTVDTGTRRIVLTGANIPANGSCEIKIRLKPSTAGVHVDRLEAGAVRALNTFGYQGSPSATLNAQPMGVFALQMFAIPLASDYTGVGLDITGPGGNFTLRGQGTANRPQVRLPAGRYTAVAVMRPGMQTSIDCPTATVVQDREFLCTMTVATRSGPEPGLAFDPSPVAAGADSTLTLTLTHPGGAPVADGALTLDLPAGLVHSGVPGSTTTCGKGVIARAGSQRLTLTGFELASGSCTLTTRVTAAITGRYTVALAAGAITGGGASSTQAASATLEVKARPVLRLQAVGNGGTGIVFRFASDDLAGAPADITTVADGVAAPVAPVAIAVKAARAPLRIRFGLLRGTLLTRAECRDARGADTGNTGVFGTLGTLGSLGAPTLTIPASQVLPGADITCVFTASAAGSATVSGRVFTDDGRADGRANDGIANGGEAGLPGARLSLNDCLGRSLAGATTDDTGRYSLPLPADAPSALCLDLAATTDRLRTGASVDGIALPAAAATTVAGNSYTYTRGDTADRIAFRKRPTVSGLDFGGVPQATWRADTQQTARAGGIALYPHTFVAATAGAVKFSVPPPDGGSAAAGWHEKIMADPDCSGKVAADAEELHPSGRPVTVAAGRPYCVVLWQSTPLGAVAGASRRVAVEAGFTLAGTSPSQVANYRLHDLTTVGNAVLRLVQEVRNLSQKATAFGVVNQARPGDLLEYRISYSHNLSDPGAGPIDGVTIRADTARFTSFVGASATVQPRGAVTCTKTTPADPDKPVDCSLPQPAGGHGTVSWNLSGALYPGDAGEVFYTVIVD